MGYIIMSYDINLCDPVTNKVLHLDSPHQMQGGTYVLGGTTELSLNITYNYSKHFVRVLGIHGIRSIYGKSGHETIPILQDAISKLADDKVDNYWASTEGNAKASLIQLLAMAKLRPDGVWNGD